MYRRQVLNQIHFSIELTMVIPVEYQFIFLTIQHCYFSIYNSILFHTTPLLTHPPPSPPPPFHIRGSVEYLDFVITK